MRPFPGLARTQNRLSLCLTDVEAEVTRQRPLRFPVVRHSRSTNTLSSARPRPSMLIATPRRTRSDVNARAVNCDP